MEAQHAAEVVANKQLLGQLMLLVALQARIQHELHLRSCLQPLGQRHSVFRLLRQAQRQRAHAAQGQPGIKGADVGAQVVVVVADPVHVLLLAGHDAAQSVAMSHVILGAGVEHDVRAVIQRPHDERREERIIHDELAAVLVGQRCDGRQIRQLQEGIGQRLQIDDLGVGLHGLLDVLQVQDLHPVGLDALGGKNVLKQAGGAHERIVRADDMVAGVQLGQQRQAHRRHAAGDHAGVLGIFQRGGLFFHGGSGGVGGAAVNAAAGLPGHGVADHAVIFVRFVVGVCRGLIDGRVQRMGHGIGAFAVLDRPGSKLHGTVIDLVLIHRKFLLRRAGHRDFPGVRG